MDEDEEAYFEGDDDDEDTENENHNDAGPALPVPRPRVDAADGDMDNLLNGKSRPPLQQRRSIEFVKAPLSVSIAASARPVSASPLVDYEDDDEDAFESLARKDKAAKVGAPNPILSTPPRERRPPPSSGRVTPSKRTSSDREFEVEEEMSGTLSGESPVSAEEVNMMDIEPKGKRIKPSRETD